MSRLVALLLVAAITSAGQATQTGPASYPPQLAKAMADAEHAKAELDKAEQELMTHFGVLKRSLGSRAINWLAFPKKREARRLAILGEYRRHLVLRYNVSEARYQLSMALSKALEAGWSAYPMPKPGSQKFEEEMLARESSLRVTMRWYHTLTPATEIPPPPKTWKSTLLRAASQYRDPKARAFHLAEIQADYEAPKATR